MSRKGDCWDNAVAESFFGTLKTELLYTLPLQTRAATRALVAEYIDEFYNVRRRHSSLDYMSPVEFELKTCQGDLGGSAPEPPLMFGREGAPEGPVLSSYQVSTESWQTQSTTSCSSRSTVERLSTPSCERHLGEVFRDLASRKESPIEEGHLMPDHVHMMISIPPKYSVSQVVGFIKGKSAIHIARVYGGRKRNFVGQHFWARGVLRDHRGPRRTGDSRLHPISTERIDGSTSSVSGSSSDDDGPVVTGPHIQVALSGSRREAPGSAGGVSLLPAVALGSMVLPVRRATKIDPMVVLRSA